MQVKTYLADFICASAGREMKGKGDDSYTCEKLNGLVLAAVSDGASIVDPKKGGQGLKGAWLSAPLISGLKKVVEDLAADAQDEIPYSDVMLALHAVDSIVQGYLDVYKGCSNCGGVKTFLAKILSVLRRGSKTSASAATLAAVIMSPSWVLTVKAGDSHLLLHFVPPLPGGDDRGEWRSFLTNLLNGTVTPLPVFGEDALIIVEASLRKRRLTHETNYPSAPASVLNDGVLYAAYRTGYSCLVGVVASDGVFVDEGLFTLQLGRAEGAQAPSLALVMRRGKALEELGKALSLLDEKLVARINSGIESLYYTVPESLLHLKLSHIVALAACHAQQTGDQAGLSRFLEALVNGGYSDPYDDASIVVAAGAIRVEGEGSDRG